MNNDSLVVSAKDPLDINNFDVAIAEIEASLYNLRFLAVETNFGDAAQRDRFRNNIIFLKRFYERAERIALDEQKNSSSAHGGLDPEIAEKDD